MESESKNAISPKNSKSNHFGSAVFLILMLQQLRQLTKGLCTFRTLIRKIRNIIIMSTIRQKRSPVQIGLHSTFFLSKVIDLLSCIVSSRTARTVSTFNVLDGISTGAKSLLSAHRTFDVARAMNLHVHLQLVSGVEFTVTFSTLK